MQPKSKLPQFGTTIFSQMSQLAETHRALNLSQGFPDFEAPSELLEALGVHALQGHNQYPPMPGIAPLREQVANKISQLYQNPVDVDTEVTITGGATQALFCAIHTLVHPGEEVIVFDPSYDSYAPAIQLAGAKSIHIPLEPTKFAIDWQRLGEALNSKTRLIIINSPHNPSGALLSQSDLDQLATLIRDRDIYILSDEVYEHLVFDGVSHVSVLAHPELYQRACVVSSFGKTYHVTGWKTGYMVAPPAITLELRKVYQYLNFCAARPIQHALADFMQQHPQHIKALPDFYQAKRDQLCTALSHSRFNFTPSRSTYFQLIDYSSIRDDLDDVAMAEWLTIQKGIATIPLSAFYQHPPEGQRLLRVCFAKKESTLTQAGELLATI